MTSTGKINLEEPRYDQSTFMGRAKHFFFTTNPLNVLATGAQLDEAKSVVEKYKLVSSSSIVKIIDRGD